MPVEEARWPDYVTDPVASFRSATEDYIRINQLDVVVLTVTVFLSGRIAYTEISFLK